MSSILQDTKKALGIVADDPSFDLDVMLQVNSAFSALTDVGVGPETGFVIEDDSKEWTDFLDAGSDGEKQVMLSKAKNYVYLKTRLIFDPPTSQFLMTAIQGQIQELEWRLNVNREATEWVDPNPPTVDQLEDVFEIDGGSP